MPSSTLLFDRPAYKNVICLGHILAEDGSKMSKSRGNVVSPWEVMNTHGADATRWYMYTASPPGNSRRFSVNLVGETVRKFLNTLWNTYSFFVTYANLSEWRAGEQSRRASENLLDRWVLSELNLLVRNVTQAMEELRRARRDPADRRLCGQRQQLVRAAQPAPLLGRRPGGAADAVRGAGDGGQAAGARRRRSWPRSCTRTWSRTRRRGRARQRAPGALAAGRRRRRWTSS